jgi:NAD(P)-dependent dehydrogenase (short-subunit alcohol dehydrogenase family)
LAQIAACEYCERPITMTDPAPFGNFGQSIVVTGVSSGIGYATAKFATEKCVRVFGSVSNVEDADRLRRELGSAYEPLIFDVRDEAAVRAEAARVNALLSGRTLLGLVNNAGISIPGPLALQPLEEIRRQIEINLVSAFIVTQTFLPCLGLNRSLQGDAGRIVNISSLGGKIGQPFGAAYSASKYGIEGFSESLRRELRLCGIKVIVVGPAAVKTRIWEKAEPFLGRYAGTQFGEAFDAALRTMLSLERFGMEPRDAAELIWHALTTKRPKLRYSPARHPILQQLVIRALPRRVLDWAFERLLRR